MRACKDCDYVKFSQDTLKCHARPPQLVMIESTTLTRNGIPIAKPIALFPIVEPHNWCGRYKQFKGKVPTPKGNATSLEGLV